MMKISFRLVFLIFIVSIIFLQSRHCQAASLNTSPTNNTVTAAAAYDSDHRCLIADVAHTDSSFNSDPRFVSTLASNPVPVTSSVFTANIPSVSCPPVNGRYTSCLGERQNTAPGCRSPYDRSCYKTTLSL